MKETTQLGAELIGDRDIEGDAEVVALAIHLLLESGLTDFQLDIGHVGLFKALVAEAGMDEETVSQLRVLIESKNYFGVEALVEKLTLSDETAKLLLKLPELFGSGDIIAEARSMTCNAEALKALDEIEKLCQLIAEYGFEKYITIDLGMLTEYDYYTGMIFRGYTYGTGDAVVKGGRYDHLIEKFGKKSPSIGFAIVIDELVSALTRQKIRIVYPRKNTIIIYAEGRQLEAIRLAKDFRRKAKNAELLKKDENSGLEDYIRYGNDYYAGSLVYIEETGEVTMVNLVTGEQKIVNSTDRS